jgi:hypothetical protein
MPREIAFIDSRIPDLDAFLSGLRPGVEAIVLSSSTSAPKQIASALSP